MSWKSCLIAGFFSIKISHCFLWNAQILQVESVSIVNADGCPVLKESRELTNSPSKANWNVISSASLSRTVKNGSFLSLCSKCNARCLVL